MCCNEFVLFLIYNIKQGISSANDLIQIMNIGNQFYLSLSQLARQSYLMRTELPTMLNVLDTDYQLEYSESYTGTVGRETTIAGYQCCTSLQIAFESLLSQNYTNFILTVGCIGVSIYCNVDIGFKIFDSQARDVYSRAYPQGTCVFLEALSLDSLVCYFQSPYNNDMFEVTGVHFNAVPNSIVLPQDYAHETVNFNLSCVVAIYSLCYSIMKSCSYWNSNILATIVDNSKRVRDNLCLSGCISSSNLPKTVDVCGAEVSFNVLSDNKEGPLCDSVQSKSILENAIINNDECTGFLMWLPCYCIGVSINLQRSPSICILSWFIMKITYKQFSILKTLMAQVHLLRQLALLKMNTSLQGITKYNLYHVHVQMLTEVKEKNLEKLQTETRL